MGMGPPVDEDDEIDFGGGTVPEAVTLFAAMSVQPTQARKTLYNNFIAGLQADGNWTSLDDILILAAHDSQAALLNIKNPATFIATLHGTAPPAFEVDRGFTTDAVDNYIDTNYNPSTAGLAATQNSASQGVWVRNNAQVDASSVGQFDGTDGTSLAPRTSADRIVIRLNQASSNNIATGTILTSVGLTYGNRSGASAVQAGRNGVLAGSGGTTSTAVNNLTLKIGTINLIAFAGYQYAAYFYGASRTEAQHLQIYNRFLAYLQGVGAA